MPRARSKRQWWAHVTPAVKISQRPSEAADRAIPGHWEGDLIIGLHRSGIATQVERSTRFTLLVPLPRELGYGTVARTKNGPPLAGYGATTMKNALAAAMTTLPKDLRRCLTWDRGKELSAHVAFTAETGISVYFADAHSTEREHQGSGLMEAQIRRQSPCPMYERQEQTACLGGMESATYLVLYRDLDVPEGR